MFIQGALSNISNPKIAVFYFAFLPQFVDPATLHPTGILLLLGSVFALITFLIKAPIGYALVCCRVGFNADHRLRVMLYRSGN